MRNKRLAISSVLFHIATVKLAYEFARTKIPPNILNLLLHYLNNFEIMLVWKHETVVIVFIVLQDNLIIRISKIITFYEQTIKDIETAMQMTACAILFFHAQFYSKLLIFKYFWIDRLSTTMYFTMHYYFYAHFY